MREIVRRVRPSVVARRREKPHHFSTKDTNTRRLLEGSARELTAALDVKGLKVKSVRVLREPDPDEPPPVPVHRTEER